LEYILGSDNWFWFSLPNFSVLRLILENETSHIFQASSNLKKESLNEKNEIPNKKISAPKKTKNKVRSILKIK